MIRYFDNPHDLSMFVIMSRLAQLDPLTRIEFVSFYTFGSLDAIRQNTPTALVRVDSTLTDKQITAALASPQTATEAAVQKIKADAKSEAIQAQKLWGLSVADAETYCKENTGDLKAIQVYLKELTRMVKALQDEIWPEDKPIKKIKTP
jgi:hypothetical protein